MRKIYIGGAWPYANGSLHLGHIASMLPVDILARYHRLKGDEVLAVSGTDCHGTPITIRAEKEGKDPEEIARFFDQEFRENFLSLGFSYDLYTNTLTENHREIVQDFFLKLLEKGLVYKKEQDLFYCPKDKRFLVDRFVEGTCALCGYLEARGDQCDNCGEILDANQLINPRCKLCGTEPELRKSEHFFLKISEAKWLIDWVKNSSGWRANAINFTLNWLKEGFNDRAITRDIEYGIPIPLEGFENKRIYVWFEAIIGYFSASVEWAKKTGDEKAWEKFWQKDAKDIIAYYVHGKDNIPFHTIFWPFELDGYGKLRLPDRIVSSEYLNLEGRQLSTSRNWAVWVPEYLKKFDPDPLRYYLVVNGPETKDSNFAWVDFYEHNNSELLGVLGNLINRVLTFTYRNYEGKVPQRGEIRSEDQKLLSLAEETYDKASRLIERLEFRKALREIFVLAKETNIYLEKNGPWLVIKEDKEKAGHILNIALQVVANLTILINPFLPFISQEAQKILKLEKVDWQYRELKEGYEFNEPRPLVKKLELEEVKKEQTKLGYKE